MIRKYLQLAGRFIEKNRYSGVAVSLVSFLLVALFCLTTVYERFELNLYDLRFKLKPSIEEWDRLAFLDIDENSLTIVGQFPWPPGPVRARDGHPEGDQRRADKL